MSSAKTEPSFEEALEKLEALVSSMESGDIPLATLVEKFEEGSKLVKMCESRLKQAELKIEKLRQENEEAVLDAYTPDDEAKGPAGR
jgi:exodeoxyribonuclease VII small subunit